jgi:hypothetical protein
MRFTLNADLARRIERHVDEVAHERPIVDEQAVEIARRHRCLPLFRGRDGYYALSLAGEVVEFRWQHFDEPEPELFDGRAYGCVAVGSLKYDELAQLLPTRQADASLCEHCAGSGQHPLATTYSDPRVICECGGLGFIPTRNDTPATYLEPSTGPAVFPDAIPTTYKASRFIELCADHELESDGELQQLLLQMFHQPEVEVFYVRPKDRGGNARIDAAIQQGLLLQGEQRFYYFQVDENCNFAHVSPTRGDDARVEYMFGYEKRDFVWAKRILQTQMYVRMQLTLSERVRRDIDAALREERNPFEAKPGAFGFSVDLFKLASIVRDRYRQWRARRRSDH